MPRTGSALGSVEPEADSGAEEEDGAAVDTDSLLMPGAYERRQAGLGRFFTRPLLLGRTVPALVALAVLAVLATAAVLLVTRTECVGMTAGSRCESCASGYYINQTAAANTLPRCLPCSCNTSGTLDTICAPESGACLCKGNVIGTNCSNCAPDMWNFTSSNPDGCQGMVLYCRLPA